MINYKADKNQMSFMQLLSQKADQSVTLHCQNTIATKDAKGNQKKAVSLMSWNDLEYKHKGKFQYEVVKDECWGEDWAEAVLRINTDRPTRLPVVDLKLADFEDFSIKISTDCRPFSIQK